MPVYKCEKCEKRFVKKYNLTQHLSRKIPCNTKPITAGKIMQKIEKEVKEAKEEMKEMKEQLEGTKEVIKKTVKKTEELEKNQMGVVDSMEQTLYLDGIVGERANNDIITILIIRLLENKFKTNEIDIMNIEKYKYNNRLINETNIKYCLINELISLKNDEDIRQHLENIWKNVLCEHPVTKIFCKKNRYITATKDVTIANLVRQISKIKLNDINMDNFADLYQQFIHKNFKSERGSRLGQHFTPRNIIKFMVNDIINTLDENSNIIDPFCGTCGFLLELYIYMKKYEKDPVNYLNGTEIDADVYKYSIVNLLLASGKICDGIKCDDAFKKTDKKYSHILTNPPFGGTSSKGQLDSEWFATIKTNNKNLLTLQLMMKLLDENGYCSMIWPYGGEISGTKKAELSIRKKLIEEFSLEKVILLPKGIFEYTNIATVILKFTTGKTESVTFSKFDGKNEIIEFIKSIDEIKEKKYSLRLEDYIEKEKINYKINFEMKKLGDICEFLSKSKRSASFGNDAGLYPFYKSSKKITSYVDEPDYKKESIIIGDGGAPNINYSDKFSVSDHCYILQNKNDINYKLKYIYYYLLNNIEIMENLYTGVGIKNISKVDISNLEIPVPPIEEQEQFIIYSENKLKNIENKNILIKQFEDAITQTNEMAKLLF